MKDVFEYENFSYYRLLYYYFLRIVKVVRGCFVWWNNERYYYCDGKCLYFCEKVMFKYINMVWCDRFVWIWSGVMNIFEECYEDCEWCNVILRYGDEC